MGNTMRIFKKMSFDNPPKPFWVIQKIVTPNGLYITLPGIYGTEESALKALNGLREISEK